MISEKEEVKKEMKSKRDKKLLDKEIEEQMDKEFVRLVVYPHVHHFRDVPPFNAVTVVTPMPFHWEEIASIIAEYPQGILQYNPATFLLQKLAIVHDLHGVAFKFHVIEVRT